MLFTFLPATFLLLHFNLAIGIAPNLKLYSNHNNVRPIQKYFSKNRFGENPMNFDDPDCKRTTVNIYEDIIKEQLEIINNKGYYGEEHHVITKDGYILGVQRIPSPKGRIRDGMKRPVVFLQHGLEGCSFNWVANLENQSLGFILADAGFDVWLGNSRGNKYSTNHTFLSPESKKFWRFSWDHMAMYDLPATVDYILENTGNKQLYYVGHSQGTLIGFAQFSSNLEFAKKIKAFFALAPVARVGHINNGINVLAQHVKELLHFFDKFGYYKFLPSDGLWHKYEEYSCSDKNLEPELCENLFLAMWPAEESEHLNQTRIPVYTAHCPSGTSTQNMAHFGQMVNSDQFQKFDYAMNDSGRLNQFHYGQKTPPLYHPSKLNVPTILFHSDIDDKADPIDVAWLTSEINKTIVENYHYTDYTHSDFILGMNAAKDVYNHIINYILKMEKPSFFHY